jgi:hypothetical protein
MFKYNVQQLKELKQMTDNLREMEGTKVEELTPELLKQLVALFWSNKKYAESLIAHSTQSISTVDEQLFGENFSGACGCLGPQDGELYCGCAMERLRYQYRYDIALVIMDQKSFTISRMKELLIEFKENHYRAGDTGECALEFVEWLSGHE